MGEEQSLLSIDPAILVLQIVAFGILYFLLRRYLFRPLLGLMAEREKEIAEALDAGERARGELARIDEERVSMLGEAREQGREQVRQLVLEGEEARERLLNEAREEAQEIRQRAKETVQLEREEAMIELRREVVDLALLAASRAVLGRLDEEKHRQVIDEFIAGLEQKE
ncbi:MAG: F0F1 ATP synthase subunit B [Armatimonadota bacterium]|nr:MAG: F0F1 ATP synthase subunit B [Armatimonadota bacterium]